MCLGGGAPISLQRRHVVGILITDAVTTIIAIIIVIIMSPVKIC